eukprot:scaffold12173_cov20-Tisochrysis_lutea.AAC.2
MTLLHSTAALLEVDPGTHTSSVTSRNGKRRQHQETCTSLFPSSIKSLFLSSVKSSLDSTL